MDVNILKKALIKGIPLGLILTAIVVLVRTLLNEGSFFTHLSSLYGILSLICFPVACVLFFYFYDKKAGK